MGIPLASTRTEFGESIESASRDTERIPGPEAYLAVRSPDQAVAEKWKRDPRGVKRDCDDYRASTESRLLMLGTVRPKGKCPKCGEAFVALHHPRNRQEVLDFECPRCETKPSRYIADARQFKDKQGKSPGRIFSDMQGNPIDSHRAGSRIIEAIRQEKQDGRFDATKWNRRLKDHLKLSEKAKEYLDHLGKMYPDAGHAQSTRSIFNLHILPGLDGAKDIREFEDGDIEGLGGRLRAKGRETEGKKKGQPLAGLPPGEAAISENMVRSCLRALKACLNYFKEKKIISEDQMPTFPILSPIPRVNMGWIGPEEQDPIIENVRGNHGDIKILLETTREVGARPNTVICAVKRDLDRGGIWIIRAVSSRTNRLKPTKTGVIARKQLSESLYDRLVKHAKDKKPNDWLFLNSKGKPFTRSWASKLWKKAAHDAGIDDVGFYVGVRASKMCQMREEGERQLAAEITAQGDWTNWKTPQKHYVRDERERRKGSNDGTGLAPVE